MQVGDGEIDDALAGGVLDVGVRDVPFARDRPVENLRAGRQLRCLNGDVAPDDLQRLPNAIAGDAAADRKELGGERIHALAYSVGDGTRVRKRGR
jgi:hypothetical protein